jgi:hypothetical protein
VRDQPSLQRIDFVLSLSVGIVTGYSYQLCGTSAEALATALVRSCSGVGLTMLLLSL